MIATGTSMVLTEQTKPVANSDEQAGEIVIIPDKSTKNLNSFPIDGVQVDEKMESTSSQPPEAMKLGEINSINNLAFDR